MDKDKRGKRCYILKSLLNYLVGKKNGSQAYRPQAEAWEIVVCEICPDHQEKTKGTAVVGTGAGFLRELALSMGPYGLEAPPEHSSLPNQLPGHLL